MKRLCAINPIVPKAGQLDHLTRWIWMKRLLLFDLLSCSCSQAVFKSTSWHFSWKSFVRLLPLVPRSSRAEYAKF